MKKYRLILVTLLLTVSQVASAQLFTIYLDNNDFLSRQVLGLQLAATSVRLVEQKVMTATLATMVAQEKYILETKYGKNKYDSNSAFITSASKTAALSLGSEMASSKLSKGYYLTKNKREFMQDIGLDKLMLSSLQVLDYDNITADNRQEIYRLRNEIVKEYSKNDSDVIGLLLLPAAKYTAEGDNALSTVIKAVELLN